MASQMTDQTDAELLGRFVKNRCEAAFRGLMERHLNLVFGTALRRTNDRGAAEEITQNVFVTLTRKAAWLQNTPSLAGWLHQTAVLEARQWWRGETRRREREKTANELETIMKTSGESDSAMEGLLDEALLALREGDRQAVLLRFVEGCNHREIGKVLGVGEDAARKRVDRAMEQMTAFFKKHGVIVGSTTALAALLTNSSTAAPAGLAGMVLQAISNSGGMTTSPWLAKLLGMGRAQLAGVCLLTLLVPTVWQEARLISAQWEKQSLERLLASLQSQQSDQTAQLQAVQRQIKSAASESRTNSALEEMGVDGLDARLFAWDEKAEYVRVPKSVLKRITFDGYGEAEGIFNKTNKQVSPTLLAAMGLNQEEQARVQEVFARNLNAYNGWVESNSYLTDYPTAATTLTNQSFGRVTSEVMELNSDTRVWVTPPVSADGESWQAEFRKELAGAMGNERAELLLRVGKDDESLTSCLMQFGTKGAFILVTPNPEGGFWLSQKSGKGWAGYRLYNNRASFSEVLEPTVFEPFDEAGARQKLEKMLRENEKEIKEDIKKHPDEFPDGKMPSVEILLENSRESWQRAQEITHFSIVRRVLDHPLPEPLTDYLRQWRAAHPEVPNKAP